MQPLLRCHAEHQMSRRRPHCTSVSKDPQRKDEDAHDALVQVMHDTVIHDGRALLHLREDAVDDLVVLDSEFRGGEVTGTGLLRLLPALLASAFSCRGARLCSVTLGSRKLLPI